MHETKTKLHKICVAACVALFCLMGVAEEGAEEVQYRKGKVIPSKQMDKAILVRLL